MFRVTNFENAIFWDVLDSVLQQVFYELFIIDILSIWIFSCSLVNKFLKNENWAKFGSKTSWKTHSAIDHDLNITFLRASTKTFSLGASFHLICDSISSSFVSIYFRHSQADDSIFEKKEPKLVNNSAVQDVTRVSYEKYSSVALSRKICAIFIFQSSITSITIKNH